MSKVKAGRYMVNEDDRHGEVDHYEYHFYHSVAKYGDLGSNKHFEEVRLVDDRDETAASYIYAVHYMLNNPKKTGVRDFFNPMAHFDNKEYDYQRGVRDSLVLSNDIELDRDDCYDLKGW